MRAKLAGPGEGRDAERESRNERLVDIYNRYFQSVPADTDELRDLAFRLRYQVYCVEHPFEDPGDNEDGRERDAFDSHSLHGLLFHRTTGTVAGAVRLVLPEAEANADLPIRQVCDDRLLRDDNPALPRQRTAEISRFAVAKAFRRRLKDRETTVGSDTSDEDPRRLIPHISLGLMRSIVAMTTAAGMTHLCAVMEPALLRLLARLGIHFTDLGPRIEYHGKRQPCFSDLDALLARTWAERRDVWELLTCDGATWPLNRDLARTQAAMH